MDAATVEYPPTPLATSYVDISSDDSIGEETTEIFRRPPCEPPGSFPTRIIPLRANFGRQSRYCSSLPQHPCADGHGGHAPETPHAFAANFTENVQPVFGARKGTPTSLSLKFCFVDGNSVPIFFATVDGIGTAALVPSSPHAPSYEQFCNCLTGLRGIVAEGPKVIQLIFAYGYLGDVDIDSFSLPMLVKMWPFLHICLTRQARWRIL
ncbi:MAG: hypothetical protein LBB38_01735 [Puniceicoccales bacterium]|nr:hypothetical protein [Puniceicoccales bacterium]